MEVNELDFDRPVSLLSSRAALRITRFREVGGEILTVRLPGGEVVPLGR